MIPHCIFHRFNIVGYEAAWARHILRRLKEKESLRCFNIQQLKLLPLEGNRYVACVTLSSHPWMAPINRNVCSLRPLTIEANVESPVK